MIRLYKRRNGVYEIQTLMILEIATDDWEVGDRSDLSLLLIGCNCLPVMSLHKNSVSYDLGPMNEQYLIRSGHTI